jgi:Domain of unknown function (DUF4332)
LLIGGRLGTRWLGNRSTSGGHATPAVARVGILGSISTLLGQVGGWLRRVVLSLPMSMVLLVLSAAALVILGSIEPLYPNLQVALLIVLAVVVALFGVWLFARTTGARLALQVEARSTSGQADAAAAAYVVARLRALGSAPPRGLEVPERTDVTTLPESALSTLPEGRIAAAVLRVLRAALPSVPWHATVTLVDEDRATVAVTRNGRIVETVSMTRPEPPLPTLPTESKGEQDDDVARSRAQLLTAAAAFILVRLSEQHRDLAVGLCGATSWESVACHVIATEPLVERDDRKVIALLARAVDLDPNNALARVAYVIRSGGRYAGDKDDQQRFADTIDREYNLVRPLGKGYEALELRILFSRAASRLNVHLLNLREDPPGTSVTDVLDGARSAAVEFVDQILEIEDAKPDDKLKTFVDEMKPVASFLWQGVGCPQLTPRQGRDLPKEVRGWGERESMSLRALYDRACLHAEQGPPQTKDAIRYLEPAVGLDDLRLWARADPSFDKLPNDKVVYQRFKQLVGDPGPSSFIELPPFAQYKETLSTVGIHSARHMDANTRTFLARRLLAKAVSVSPSVVKYWRGVADLALLHAQLEKAPMLDLLLAVGVNSKADLRDEFRRSPEKLAKRLRKRAETRALVPPSRDDIAAWIGNIHRPVRPSPAPAPHDWQSLGGHLTSGPGVASWAPGHLDVFARTGDSGLAHRSFEGRWSEWEALGGTLASDPAAVSWGTGRIDVFVRGIDHALWHKWFDGDWHDWESLGGALTSGPAACSRAERRLDVFVRGTDNALWHKSFDQGWPPVWERLGGTLTSDPAAVSWGPSQIDVFARGIDHALWHKSFDGSWQDWRSLGGALTSGPAACSWAQDRLDVFVRGTDNALWHKWFHQGWSGWEQLGTDRIGADPDAVSSTPGRIDVVTSGGDNTLWHKSLEILWTP